MFRFVGMSIWYPSPWFGVTCVFKWEATHILVTNRAPWGLITKPMVTEALSVPNGARRGKYLYHRHQLQLHRPVTDKRNRKNQIMSLLYILREIIIKITCISIIISLILKHCKIFQSHFLLYYSWFHSFTSIHVPRLTLR